MGILRLEMGIPETQTWYFEIQNGYSETPNEHSETQTPYFEIQNGYSETRDGYL